MELSKQTRWDMLVIVQTYQWKDTVYYVTILPEVWHDLSLVIT